MNVILASEAGFLKGSDTTPGGSCEARLIGAICAFAKE